MRYGVESGRVDGAEGESADAFKLAEPAKSIKVDVDRVVWHGSNCGDRWWGPIVGSCFAGVNVVALVRYLCFDISSDRPGVFEIG